MELQKQLLGVASGRIHSVFWEAVSVVFALCLNGVHGGSVMLLEDVGLLPWQTGSAQGAAAYGCGKPHSWCLNSGQVCQLKIHFEGRFVIALYFGMLCLLKTYQL